MATIVIPFTYSAGGLIVASEQNSNISTIYNDYNGNITNANISASAAIADTKLATITTAGVVNFSALTVGSQAQGDVMFYSGTAWTRLVAGTSGFYLKTQGASANPKWDVLIPVVSTLTDGATPALNAALGNHFLLTAVGNRTIGVPTNSISGQKIIIEHLASGADRTLALNTGAGGFRFGTTITALTATTSAKKDYIGCIYNLADTRWDVVAYSKNH